ncbi:MAG: dihydroneopterin aldolase [Bacteroidia bacterium]|nr:dihydroneopterin aldolase [Bacteroidia bacterium]MDW8235718.1 dihydroneopterin aldolase [Bacteroidia bacterium]
MERPERNVSVCRTIGLRGVEIYAHVGYLPEERKMGRLFRADVEVEYEGTLSRDPVIDYRDIAEILREELKGERFLLEQVVQRVAEAILARWQEVRKVWIQIHKVHPPIGILAESAYAGLEMARH